MSKASYTGCMTPAMRAIPKGISREQRSLQFCASAKVCAGKAKSKEEALAICKAQPPKEPKERKPRGKKGGEPECPPFDQTTLIPYCEQKLATVVKSGELPGNTDISGICQLILG